MATGDTGTDSSGTARRARNTDFLFVGAGVAPLALMLGGRPEMAFLVLIPLLFAACLCGAWEQTQSGHGHAAGDWDGPLDGKRQSAQVTTLRDRLER